MGEFGLIRDAINNINVTDEMTKTHLVPSSNIILNLRLQILNVIESTPLIRVYLRCTNERIN